MIDEAQNALNSSMVPFYQGIGKFGVSIWTIHQNHQDLVNADKNILPMVMNNAAVGIYLGGRDSVSKKELESTAGKVMSTRTSTNSKDEDTIIETMECRISDTDFNLVNNYKSLAFVKINGHAGYCAFNHIFICRLAGFSCSREQYDAYLRMPWPVLTNAVDASDFDPPKEDRIPPSSKTPEQKTGTAIGVLAAFQDALRAAHTGAPA